MIQHKFTHKDKAKIFHTSGYARVSQGDQIGSAAGAQQTATQRIESAAQEGRIVYGYHRSQLGGAYGRVRARQRDTPTSLEVGDVGNNRRMGGSATAGASTGSRQSFNASSSRLARPNITFREPPSRGYNPYA